MNTLKEFGKKNWWIVLLFGMIGQIAWTVENMYFNLFVFETIAPDLEVVTLMVQLSGIAATVTTLIAGTLSDKLGNRKKFIAYGYMIWGVTVALFGMISAQTISNLFGVSLEKAVQIALVTVVVGDCVMTMFGSTANDAAFNAWVTDNTEVTFRGKVEGVLATLPLLSMLIVAGGFGIIVEAVGYPMVFLGLGVVIIACGVGGLFLIQDSPYLQKQGGFRDIVYGFKPSVIKGNKTLYLNLAIVAVYGIACQIFMPYIIIYMKTYLHFTVVEYSIVFGVAILAGAALNIWFGRIADKLDKAKLLYIATAIFAVGLVGMWFSHFESHIATLIIFGLFGFLMITGYILVSALSGALTRDYTPEKEAGKMQGVRMIFSVFLPMIFGPMIGNAINKAANIPLVDAGADAMTTAYVPAPEIFLAGALFALLMYAVIPLLVKSRAKEKEEQQV
ncbi:MAG: MFS transporter [Clostridia bacterium]|nr:MFS transporter [Clostridia bacterium]